MQIQVRFFAALRERLGISGLTVELPDEATVAEVWAAAVAGEAAPDNVLAARNMSYVDWSSPVDDGDEVAFFPPVTGGCA
jgi:molybdopterin synthase sulfur carrier subunit